MAIDPEHEVDLSKAWLREIDRAESYCRDLEKHLREAGIWANATAEAWNGSGPNHEIVSLCRQILHFIPAVRVRAEKGGSTPFLEIRELRGLRTMLADQLGPESAAIRGKKRMRLMNRANQRSAKIVELIAHRSDIELRVQATEQALKSGGRKRTARRAACKKVAFGLLLPSGRTVNYKTIERLLKLPPT